MARWHTIQKINNKSIQQKRLQKMVNNLLHGTLDHSKTHSCDFCMMSWPVSFLNDMSWHGKVGKCWKTFSTKTICHIKSIQQTKLKKTAIICNIRPFKQVKLLGPFLLVVLLFVQYRAKAKPTGSCTSCRGIINIDQLSIPLNARKDREPCAWLRAPHPYRLSTPPSFFLILFLHIFLIQF